MLTLNSLTVRLGGHTVLDRASAALPAKSRVGLVGRNGAGKSTLLKAIAGLAEADDGAIEMPRGSRIGYLAQDAPDSRGTPFETVLAADSERTRLPLVAPPARRWEPEPLRSLAVKGALGLAAAEDRASAAGRAPTWRARLFGLLAGR